MLGAEVDGGRVCDGLVNGWIEVLLLSESEGRGWKEVAF
jgi:hypothetical protein